MGESPSFCQILQELRRAPVDGYKSKNNPCLDSGDIPHNTITLFKQNTLPTTELSCDQKSSFVSDVKVSNLDEKFHLLEKCLDEIPLLKKRLDEKDKQIAELKEKPTINNQVLQLI